MASCVASSRAKKNETTRTHHLHAYALICTHTQTHAHKCTHSAGSGDFWNRSGTSVVRLFDDRHCPGVWVQLPPPDTKLKTLQIQSVLLCSEDQSFALLSALRPGSSWRSPTTGKLQTKRSTATKEVLACKHGTSEENRARL